MFAAFQNQSLLITVETIQVDNEVINNVHSSTHLRECYSSEC